MKKYLYGGLLMALMAVLSFSLVSCDDDDDDSRSGSDGSGAVKAGKYTLTINGDVWHSRADHEPRYNGSFYRLQEGGFTFITCRFVRNDYILDLGCSELSFWISTELGYDITKGMEIAKTPFLNWGSGNTRFSITDGPWAITDETNTASYGERYGPTGGKAIIEDLSEGEFITINFSNYQLPLSEIQYAGKGSVPETLILDGTVTFTYVDSYMDE